MLFEARFWPLIANGSLELTLRRWRRCQVRAGRRYRTAGGRIEVDAVDVIDVNLISDRDARRSGYASAAALIADLRGERGAPVYRVAFHLVGGPDPRDELAGADQLTPDDVTELERRLTRLDRASTHGAWTGATLAAIEARAGTRAAELAASLGRETGAFKADVRKLKGLGLTISLEVGYRLSPRGTAYWHLTHADEGPRQPGR